MILFVSVIAVLGQIGSGQRSSSQDRRSSGALEYRDAPSSRGGLSSGGRSPFSNSMTAEGTPGIGDPNFDVFAEARPSFISNSNMGPVISNRESREFRSSSTSSRNDFSASNTTYRETRDGINIPSPLFETRWAERTAYSPETERLPSRMSRLSIQPPRRTIWGQRRPSSREPSINEDYLRLPIVSEPSIRESNIGRPRDPQTLIREGYIERPVGPEQPIRERYVGMPTVQEPLREGYIERPLDQERQIRDRYIGRPSGLELPTRQSYDVRSTGPEQSLREGFIVRPSGPEPPIRERQSRRLTGPEPSGREIYIMRPTGLERIRDGYIRRPTAPELPIREQLIGGRTEPQLAAREGYNVRPAVLETLGRSGYIAQSTGPEPPIREGPIDRVSSSETSIREGYIGATGGRDGFPLMGGYCAGEACADGGLREGIANGIGSGALSEFQRRRRTGETEDISLIESAFNEVLRERTRG